MRIDSITRSSLFVLGAPLRIVLPWTALALGIIGALALVYKYRAEIARLFCAKKMDGNNPPLIQEQHNNLPKQISSDKIYQSISARNLNKNKQLFLDINELAKDDKGFDNIKNAAIDQCKFDKDFAKELLFNSNQNRQNPNNCLAFWMECEKFIFKNEKDDPYHFEFMTNCIESTLNCTEEQQEIVLYHLIVLSAELKGRECYLFYDCLSKIADKYKNKISNKTIFLKMLCEGIKGKNYKNPLNETLGLTTMYSTILDNYHKFKELPKICLLIYLERNKKEIKTHSKSEEIVLNVKAVHKIEENLGEKLTGNQLSDVITNIANARRTVQEKHKEVNQAVPKPISQIICSYIN